MRREQCDERHTSLTKQLCLAKDLLVMQEACLLTSLHDLYSSPPLCVCMSVCLSIYNSAFVSQPEFVFLPVSCLSASVFICLFATFRLRRCLLTSLLTYVSV